MIDGAKVAGFLCEAFTKKSASLALSSESAKQNVGDSKRNLPRNGKVLPVVFEKLGEV